MTVIEILIVVVLCLAPVAIILLEIRYLDEGIRVYNRLADPR